MMDYGMKENGRKWWLRALAAAVVMLTVACSAEDADSYDAPLQPETTLSVAASGVYEGEWTVNRQVVDTARLVVVDNVIQIRLPEKYLLSTCFGLYGDKWGDNVPDEDDISSVGNLVSYEPHDTPVTVQMLAQGYSEQSQYMSFAGALMLDGGSPLRFNNCSFEATVDNVPYRIDLLAGETATAVLQNATGQWTLGIPIDAFLVSNLETGEVELNEISSTTIYYNTKKKIR